MNKTNDDDDYKNDEKLHMIIPQNLNMHRNDGINHIIQPFKCKENKYRIKTKLDLES